MDIQWAKNVKTVKDFAISQNLILIFAVVLEKLKYGTVNAVFIRGLIFLPVALLETTSR